MSSEARKRDGRKVVRVDRRVSWTKARQRAFLATLSATSNVSEAARAVGLDRRGAYAFKQRDAAFAQAWAEALEAGYSELEWLLLKQVREGSERTETVIDGATGKVKQTKTVHSYPLTVAMRLWLAHRDEVRQFRETQIDAEDDEQAIARVRAEMAEVRRRLIGDEDGG